MDTFSKHLNAAHKMLSKRGQRYKSAGGFQKRQHSFIPTEARDLGVLLHNIQNLYGNSSWSVSSHAGTQQVVRWPSAEGACCGA